MDKRKIIQGSGLAAILGTLSVAGVQYQENKALTEALNATQHALSVMADKYEHLVQDCINRIDRPR